MADVMTIGQRSRVMSRIKGVNTTPERYVHDLAKAAGLSFVRHDASLPGKPDFVFPRDRLVVFVDGDFWHGWRFSVWKHRLSSFWLNKITGNRARDQRNFSKLRRLGWRVLRVWEHEIETDVVQCVQRIAALLGKTVDLYSLERHYATMPPLKRRKCLPKP